MSQIGSEISNESLKNPTDSNATYCINYGYDIGCVANNLIEKCLLHTLTGENRFLWLTIRFNTTLLSF
ncbi:hypothetical protein HGI79_04125 [Clostridium sp. DJ247]|nr:hypothetical protein [Clostridium sp. DJ247]